MLKVLRILCIAQALAGSAAMLAGCGQKGDLVLPDSPESRGRASLPQSLNPWHQGTAPTATPLPTIAPAAPPAAAPASEPKR